MLSNCIVRINLDESPAVRWPNWSLIVLLIHQTSASPVSMQRRINTYSLLFEFLSVSIAMDEQSLDVVILPHDRSPEFTAFSGIRAEAEERGLHPS